MGWLLVIPALALVVSGCMTVGPDYSQPPVPKPNYFDVLQSGTGDIRPRATITNESLADWWRIFNDSTLTGLMEEALESNLDMHEARSLVREARSQLRISQANLFPSLDAGGAYTRSRSSENAISAGVSGAIDLESDYYSAGFDASWEIDIFGGARRSVEAARADIEVQQASLESVWISLIGELSQTYVDTRTYQHRLSVAEKNLRAQAETLSILVSRLAAGLSDELDVQQARYNLEQTRSTIPSLRSGLESSINRLVVLTGKMPGELHERLMAVKPIPVPPFEVVNDIPADTLRQRPDVRRAERELAAQTARIGEAESELYPKFTLTGSIGLASLKSSTLFNSESQTWSIGPGFSWPILHAGSIQANVRVQTERKNQLWAKYQKTLLTAAQEIRDSLTSYSQEQQRLAALQSAAEAAGLAVEIAQDKYRHGLVDFNSVLDAQRSLFSLEDEVVASQGILTQNFIALYKALGGGWQATTL